jgi:hypothetical protein
MNHIRKPMRYIFVTQISTSIPRSSLRYYPLSDWMHSHPQITVTPLHTGYVHSKFIRSTDDKTSNSVYTNPYVQEEDASTWRRTIMRLCVSICLDPFSIQAYQRRLVTSYKRIWNQNDHLGNVAFQRLALPFRIRQNPLPKFGFSGSSFYNNVCMLQKSTPKPAVLID